jgi:hypothetical protein
LTARGKGCRREEGREREGVRDEQDDTGEGDKLLNDDDDDDDVLGELELELDDDGDGLGSDESDIEQSDDHERTNVEGIVACSTDADATPNECGMAGNGDRGRDGDREGDADMTTGDNAYGDESEEDGHDDDGGNTEDRRVEGGDKLEFELGLELGRAGGSMTSSVGGVGESVRSPAS